MLTLGVKSGIPGLSAGRDVFSEERRTRFETAGAFRPEECYGGFSGALMARKLATMFAISQVADTATMALGPLLHAP